MHFSIQQRDARICVAVTITFLYFSDQTRDAHACVTVVDFKLYMTVFVETGRDARTCVVVGSLGAFITFLHVYMTAVGSNDVICDSGIIPVFSMKDCSSCVVVLLGR